MNLDVNGTPEIAVSSPLLTVAKLMQRRQVQSSSLVSGSGSNLASPFVSGNIFAKGQDLVVPVPILSNLPGKEEGLKENNHLSKTIHVLPNIIAIGAGTD